MGNLVEPQNPIQAPACRLPRTSTDTPDPLHPYANGVLIRVKYRFWGRKGSFIAILGGKWRDSP